MIRLIISHIFLTESHFIQLKSAYEELDALKLLPLLDAIDHALIRHVMRKNPQPHALSFGFKHKTLLRTFEFGAGVGISKNLHSSDEIRLLDDRCSRPVALTLKTSARASLRKGDLEALGTAFQNLVVACTMEMEVQTHLIVKKSFNKTAKLPDGLTLVHNIPMRTATVAVSTEIVPRAQAIEPDFDWLRLAQTEDCDLGGSSWASADPAFFWVHCFPAIQLSQHSNGLRFSTTASPRDLLLQCKDQNYIELFDLCNLQVAESQKQTPPTKRRKRARVAPGYGNAFHQRHRDRYVPEL